MGFFSRFFGPPTPAQFAKLVIRTMSKLGDTRTAQYDADKHRITFSQDGKQSGVTNLANFYREYCQLDRKSRAAWLKRTCISCLRTPDMPDEYEDARHDLLPSLKSRSFLDCYLRDESLADKHHLQLVSVPVSEHLVACLVYDLPHSMAFVTTEQLQKWGVTPYEAMEAAIENLDGQPGVMASIGDKLFILQSGDAYDATRLLKMEKIRGLSVEGDVVALALNRDCLMITGADDSQGLEIMADLAEKSLDDPRPICSIPVRLRGDEWQTWLPPDDHPSIEKYRQFALQFYAQEYHDQKQYLDRVHGEHGPDVFVASFSVIEFKNGRARSYALWSKGLPTWLPKTDLIVFQDPDLDTTDLVPWEDAARIMGPALSSLDVYPERWAVDAFPNDEQLTELRKYIVPPDAD